MNTADFINDIPLDAATSAHSGTSFTPEKRGEQVRQGYAETMAGDYAELAAEIQNKPEMQSTLDAEFARYREGYKARYLAKLRSDARCVSWMIAGPSNFPVRRMEKRNRVAHKRLEELVEFRSRALDAIRKHLFPELRPIMSGDSDAVGRLKEKIAEAERTQELMKSANIAIRKHKKSGESAQTAALVSLFQSVGIFKNNPEAKARELLQPDFCGRIGFADYELQNNNANIRRMKLRLEAISRNQATPNTDVAGEHARIEDCPADNRVRLFFPGKPSEEVRSRLKASGFRWSPTIGCWQAYRNWKSIATAKQEAGLVVESTL